MIVYLESNQIIDEHVPGKNIMTGTSITRAGTNIMAMFPSDRKFVLPGTNIMRHGIYTSMLLHNLLEN